MLHGARLTRQAIQGIRKGAHEALFAAEHVYVAREGVGAGNNWANGYAQGDSVGDDILDLTDTLVEACDHLDAFSVLHSIAGGTGSGLGSFLLERLHDRYPRAFVHTASVFPVRTSSPRVALTA